VPNYPIIVIISKTKDLAKTLVVQCFSAHGDTSYGLYPGSLRPSEPELAF